MNKKKTLRITAYTVLMATLLSVLGSCTTWDNFSRTFINPPVNDGSVIKIGVYEPLTGELAKDAKDEIEGIELAHSMYGTVLGSIVELVYIDNKSDTDRAAETAQEMIDSGASIVVGSYGNMISMAAGELFREKELPAVAASCNNPLLTQTNDFYSRACYIDSFEAKGAAEFILKRLNTTAAAIMYYENSDLAKVKAEEFSTYFMETAGMDHITTAELPVDIEDLSEVFFALNSYGIKAIYLPENIENAKKIFAAAKELGYEFEWIGTSEWRGIDVEGAYYTVDFDPDKILSAMTQSFLRSYSQKNGAGSTPSEGVALGFDAYLIALAGIREAGAGADGSAIAKAITTIKDLPGATGSITMDSNGDPIKNIVIRKIVNGSPETVYTAIPGRKE